MYSSAHAVPHMPNPGYPAYPPYQAPAGSRPGYGSPLEPQKMESAYQPHFCGVPYSIPILLNIPTFIAHVRAKLAGVPEKEGHRLVMESFYVRDLDRRASILHLIAEKGLHDLAVYLLDMLATNPLCPPATNLSTETTLLALNDFEYNSSSKSWGQFESLPHPFALETSHGHTPLGIAVENLYPSLVSVFISHGADANHINRFQARSALMTVMERHDALDHSDIIEALLAAEGIDLDLQTASGTAFHVATRNGKHQYMKLLYDHGADINKTLTGECMLTAVAAANPMSRDCVERTTEYLLQIAQPSIPQARRLNIFARHGQTQEGLLHHIVKNDSLRNLMCPILRLADQLYPPYPDKPREMCGSARLLTARDSNGVSPLMLAVFSGTPQDIFLPFLTSPHVKTLSLRDRKGATTLHYARHSWEKALLSHGADVNATDCYGRSPLVSVVHGLRVTQGVIAMLQNNHSSTPNLPLINSLLDNGSDINAINLLNGRSMGHEIVASGGSGDEVIRTLQILKAEGLRFDLFDNDGNTLAHVAAQKGNIQLIEQLSELCDIHQLSSRGRTLMHTLSGVPGLQPDFVLIYSLVTLGFDLNAIDVDGNTALHLAVERRDTYIVLALVSAGCDKSVRRHDGATALDVAQGLLKSPEGYDTAALNSMIAAL